MNPITTLTPELFIENLNCVSLGTIPKAQIDLIEAKYPNYTGQINPNTDIIFWKDRIKHVNEHKNDFISDIAFQNSFENIPNIIQYPDYIGVHPKDNSIIYIKELSAHVSVAIRISPNGGLVFRTMYPITDAQLQHYISKDRIWKWPKT